MTELLLRPTRSTDAGKAGVILSDFMEDTAWMPRIHTEAEDIGFVGSMTEKGWVTVAMQGDKFAGFLACDMGEVNALYIRCSAWRQGCGVALLRHAQDVFKKLSLWTFQANIDAQAFYLVHGFAEVERTNGDGNDEHLPDIRFDWHKETS